MGEVALIPSCIFVFVLLVSLFCGIFFCLFLDCYTTIVGLFGPVFMYFSFVLFVCIELSALYRCIVIVGG